jgi:butyrate kinase
MNNKPLILVINPGSTSTKLAIFSGRSMIASETVMHDDNVLRLDLDKQISARSSCLETFLDAVDINPEDLSIIVSRGGLGKPGPAGIYEIDETMCKDLSEGKYGLHASATGPMIALTIANRYGIKSIVVDPPSTDELDDLSRISGLPEIERKSAFHALSQKAAARRYADEIRKNYEDLNLIVAHMGGGITIGAHKKGRVIDCTHGLSEGPLTPERAGALPSTDLIELAMHKNTKIHELNKRLVGSGGLKAYLGTSKAEDIEKRIADNDGRAELIYRAMAYQISKDICAMAAPLSGEVNAIILTGGLANSCMLMEWIKSRVDFLACVIVYPGEDEMTALALGGVRALNKEEEVKKYQ